MANIVIEIRMSNGDKYIADTPVNADDGLVRASDRLYRAILPHDFLHVRETTTASDNPRTMLFRGQIVSMKVTLGLDTFEFLPEYELVMPPVQAQ